MQSAHAAWGGELRTGAYRHRLPVGAAIVVLHLAALVALNLSPPPRAPEDFGHVRVTSVFFPLRPSRQLAAEPAPLPSRWAPRYDPVPPVEDPAPNISVPPVTSVPPATAAPPADNAAPASAAEIMAQARRDIGKIERSLRGNLPPIPDDEDLLRAKLGNAISRAAHGGAGTYLANYTSPDGVVITRITIGNASACVMSGTVNYVPGVLHDANKPQLVNCPKDAKWKRH